MNRESAKRLFSLFNTNKRFEDHYNSMIDHSPYSFIRRTMALDDRSNQELINSLIIKANRYDFNPDLELEPMLVLMEYLANQKEIPTFSLNARPVEEALKILCPYYRNLPEINVSGFVIKVLEDFSYHDQELIIKALELGDWQKILISEILSTQDHFKPYLEFFEFFLKNFREQEHFRQLIVEYLDSRHQRIFLCNYISETDDLVKFIGDHCFTKGIIYGMTFYQEMRRKDLIEDHWYRKCYQFIKPELIRYCQKHFEKDYIESSVHRSARTLFVTDRRRDFFKFTPREFSQPLLGKMILNYAFEPENVDIYDELELYRFENKLSGFVDFRANERNLAREIVKIAELMKYLAENTEDYSAEDPPMSVLVLSIIKQESELLFKKAFRN